MQIEAKVCVFEGVVALLGHPVLHSLSPQMQNAAFRASGIPYRYIAFDVKPELLASAVEGMRALGFRGANVTIPHKVEIVKHLDEIDAVAAQIGAVNTIVVDADGRLIGYNTDAGGLLEALKSDASFDPRGKNALIFGAGGAARACCFALASAGIDGITIVNRSSVNALSLANALRKAHPDCKVSTIALESEGQADCAPHGATYGSGIMKNASKQENGMSDGTGTTGLTSPIPHAVLEKLDLVINATPLGLWPEWAGQSPLPRDRLGAVPAECVVVDLVYRPVRTPLLKYAARRGLLTVSGLSILLHQGALAFRLWTAKPAPLDVMKAALNAALGSEEPFSELGESRGGKA
ncbi:MAG TPA: shikimate dehydrogenase [Clostridia bacterium]|nr:shikimate dehydrogenase [Clostridia bacterium]